MSGHSKWSTIKRAKGATDAKRSQLFTKLGMAIAVAARGGADPGSNFKLRLAIDRAKAASLPKDNIDRAIKRGSGGEGGAQLEEIVYEAYGPGGVAILIQALTDNRNRTSSQVRHLLERHGGRLAEAGSVGWLFESRGVLQTKLAGDHGELELALIEAGAIDIDEMGDELIITCLPQDLERVKTELSRRNLPIDYANVEPVAKTTVKIEDKDMAARLHGLHEVLDADDDVTEVYDNQA